MQLTAKGNPGGNIPFHASTPSFQAEALTEIMLSTFETEIDALFELLATDRRAATSEALIRRYATAEEVFNALDESYRRIQLKMMMLQDKLAEGFIKRDQES